MKIKSVLIIATLSVATFALCACGSRSNKTAATAAGEQTVSEALDIDRLLDEAESLADQQVTLEGVCTHICSHGGRKIFLMGSDDTKTIRVEACDLGSFDQKCVNSIVRIKGVLREQRIDEAYLQNWETQAAAAAVEQHGDTEAGCDTEKNARGETGNTVAERIADFRTRIAAREAAEGKAYLSFYFVEAESYEIAEH